MVRGYKVFALWPMASPWNNLVGSYEFDLVWTHLSRFLLIEFFAKLVLDLFLNDPLVSLGTIFGKWYSFEQVGGYACFCILLVLLFTSQHTLLNDSLESLGIIFEIFHQLF